MPGIKINFYLSFFKKFFLGRDIVIAREITKIHETFYRDSVNAVKSFKSTPKGELTIVISKIYHNNDLKLDVDIEIQAIEYLKKYSLKDVVELISKKEKISKKKVYEICLRIKNHEKNN